MPNYTATYTDLYQLSMAQVYFNENHHSQKAVFDYYFRKNPYQGGYTVFAGLETLLENLNDFQFSKEELDYLAGQHFEAKFLNYLKDFRFRGSIYSVLEGDVVFPNQPILRVEGSLLEAQLIETFLLNMLNFQSLIATKARRMRYIVPDGVLLDFGLRRAHGPGGYYASRAAFIGGFNGTSNVIAAKQFDIPVSGTMAHSFVQSYDDELQAFRDFAQNRPKNCVLLVDTYNTLKSGLPHAITVAKEMEERGEKLMGIRLDSGDLAYFAKECRKRLDEAGLSYVKIAVSNQLDEYVIKSLQEQEAPIDIYGVGTNLVVGKPDAALGGVYKLVAYNQEPRIKISENIAKITMPYSKQVYRLSLADGRWIGADAVALSDETEFDSIHHPFDQYKSMKIEHLEKEALLQPVMLNGERFHAPKSLQAIADYSAKRFAQLPLEYKRFSNAHHYKVGISKKLRDERDALIKQYKTI
ncbi:nicotinate phosphoribosyltransferase [uncultured Mesonia sp.]|uniref:nicotinate phosphoribosyltransferase n=1 Tax=uncultured Mesonia sp. TaxID=399731 RepID=UPI00374F457B